MKENMNDKLNKLIEKKIKLQARIQKMESAQKSLEKKKDTRRKILVGSYYLKKIENENSFEELKKNLDSFLTRDSDRQLFDLPLTKSDSEISSG